MHRAKPRRTDFNLSEQKSVRQPAMADLLVIQPQTVKEAGVTPPVRLDLYLSRGES